MVSKHCKENCDILCIDALLESRYKETSLEFAKTRRDACNVESNLQWLWALESNLTLVDVHKKNLIEIGKWRGEWALWVQCSTTNLFESLLAKYRFPPTHNSKFSHILKTGSHTIFGHGFECCLHHTTPDFLC
eukprot:Platyproteum_vivax@DN2089_c0_g1_i1.p2